MPRQAHGVQSRRRRGGDDLLAGIGRRERPGLESVVGEGEEDLEFALIGRLALPSRPPIDGRQAGRERKGADLGAGVEELPARDAFGPGDALLLGFVRGHRRRSGAALSGGLLPLSAFTPLRLSPHFVFVADAADLDVAF
jgi:hypothetical protein